MKTPILFLTSVLTWSGLNAQTLIIPQYASSVIAVSSEYGGGPSYHAEKALDEQNVYPACADSPEAWASNTPDGQREFLVLGFSNPQPVNTIRIYQTLAPGAIDTIYLRNVSNGVWTQVYSATAASTPCPTVLEVEISTTPYDVDAIRIAINSPAVSSWNEIDAVSIAEFDIMPNKWLQYASSVISFSSEYAPSPAPFSAAQALQTPTQFPTCGNSGSAWTSATQDGQREYLELGYAYPAPVNRVLIHQNLSGGAIDTVYLRDVETGIWHMIYSATAALTACPLHFILELNFTITTYSVDAIRIASNSPAVPSFNEIDAIGIQSDLPAGAKFSLQTGNWNSSTTWVGGVVPGANDTVIIGTAHIITLDISTAIKSLLINPGGTLTNSAANTLTLGPANGGKEYLKVAGSLNISNGIININGNIEFLAGAAFSMSGGQITVDGNDGTSGGSVANGTDLFRLAAGMSACTVTGGTIIIVDPQFNATGQCISGNYIFGAASTLKLGNGISSTPSSNPNGFGGSATYPALGHLIIDAVTTTGNRQFKSGSAISVSGNCTVTSGRFQPTAQVQIDGLLVNTGRISSSGSFKVDLDVTNSDTISVTGGAFIVVKSFINTANGVYNVLNTSPTSIGIDLLNNGIFSSHWLFMANNFGTSSNAQTIGGTGTFTIFGIEPHSNHVNGVSLLLPLTVQQLYFTGNGFYLFLGANDLTVNDRCEINPGNNGWVVINGAGKLITHNITTVSKLFPIGTTASYTPVSIVNGSGHAFSVGVKSTFTYPPNNLDVVNREWNITDITGGSVSAHITFQWNASDEDPGFTRSLCHVGRYNGSGWQLISADSPADGAGPYTRTATEVTSFSRFGVGSNGALPVHLIRFTALKYGSTVRLEWLSENETNFSHYEVERSIDGRNYTRFASVDANHQQGRSSYHVEDLLVSAAVYFYRLKMLDLDGSFSYSHIETIVMNQTTSAPYIQPNPSSGIVTITGSSIFRRVQVIDLNGRIVQDLQSASNESYNFSELLRGVYLIRLLSDFTIEILMLELE